MASTTRISRFATRRRTIPTTAGSATLSTRSPCCLTLTPARRPYFRAVNGDVPVAPEMRVEVVAKRLDFKRVELYLYDTADDLIQQPSNGPNPLGYHVHPA